MDMGLCRRFDSRAYPSEVRNEKPAKNIHAKHKETTKVFDLVEWVLVQVDIPIDATHQELHHRVQPIMVEPRIVGKTHDDDGERVGHVHDQKRRVQDP